MEDIAGEIFCDYTKWADLVASFSSAQRARFTGTFLRYILDVPRITMRENLLRYMLPIFNPATSTFVMQEGSGEIVASCEDIELIYGLRNKGFSAPVIIKESGQTSMANIPASFINKSSGNIKIEDLIDDIKKEKASDDDFVRRAMLVFIGTVAAPTSRITVPKPYYCLVEDVPRIFEINWNHFMLRFLIDSLKEYVVPSSVRAWPKGNLGLPQVYILVQLSSYFK